jgi:hypothetical protein
MLVVRVAGAELSRSKHGGTHKPGTRWGPAGVRSSRSSVPSPLPRPTSSSSPSVGVTTSHGNYVLSRPIHTRIYTRHSPSIPPLFIASSSHPSRPIQTGENNWNKLRLTVTLVSSHWVNFKCRKLQILSITLVCMYLTANVALVRVGLPLK